MTQSRTSLLNDPEFVRIDAEIDDALAMASDDLKDSMSVSDPNCYGVGYDSGYRDGLRRALCILRRLDCND